MSEINTRLPNIYSQTAIPTAIQSATKTSGTSSTAKTSLTEEESTVSSELNIRSTATECEIEGRLETQRIPTARKQSTSRRPRVLLVPVAALIAPRLVAFQINRTAAADSGSTRWSNDTTTSLRGSPYLYPEKLQKKQTHFDPSSRFPGSARMITNQSRRFKALVEHRGREDDENFGPFGLLYHGVLPHRRYRGAMS